MQMDADFKIGIDLLKRFKEHVKALAESGSTEEVRENLEVIKEIIRNAAYRINQGSGPLKDEFFSALAVIVKNAREFESEEDVKKSAKRILELLENLEKATAEA